MALHSVREVDNFSLIHRVCEHMSKPYIKWHREHSKNAKFSDVDTTRVRPLCKACIYGEDRQTATDRHRIQRPLPTVPGQCFLIDAFACGHTSQRGYKYYDLMRDGASEMIYCNFTKNREEDEIVRSFTRLWDLHPTWRVFDHKIPDKYGLRNVIQVSKCSEHSSRKGIPT